MSTHAIYPDDFAKVLIERAGQKYRPSNGTEGDCFFEAWCWQCASDQSVPEGCQIIGATMAYDVNDPDYPQEWQYGKDGQPCCTAFVPAGQPIPAPRDEHTADLFET